ncbi:MAG: CHAT domain-containing protein [Chloroflexota bacterium]|nr:MAG: CHAT domain-containing protein [Chloroflexota bacterium]
MPIDSKSLSAPFRVFAAGDCLQNVLQQVDRAAGLYLVVACAGGKYACVHLSEIIAALDGLTRLGERAALLNAPLGDLLAPFALDPVDPSTDLWQATQKRDDSPTQCVVVVSGDRVVGVLAAARRGPVVYRSGAVAKGPVVAQESGPEAGPSRRINVEVVDQDSRRLSPDAEPLQLKQTYTLVFDIAGQLKATSVIGDVFLQYQWKSGESEVELKLRLVSDDFEIFSPEQTLKVKRAGASNKARFDVLARREGRGVINALFFKDDVFIQLLTLKFTVVDGKLFERETSGKGLEAAFGAQTRHLSLTILEAVQDFQIIMTGPVGSTARLPISKQALDARIGEMRRTLRDKVVYMKEGERLVYQQSLDISPAARDQALRVLAEVGYGLYQDIFYGPAADSQTKLLGDRLRQFARQEGTLKIQIFSQHFMLPWGLLYLASDDEYDPQKIDPALFLGLRHIVEHIPLQESMQVTSSDIDRRAGLAVSINVNTDIDSQMGAPLVARQLEYWKKAEKAGKATLVQRDTAEQLLAALRSTEETRDQVIYFYCHASSKDLSEGGPDASALVLSNHERITLKDLKLMASTRRILPGEPLVFINACESAELSPLFYDGFVPYFLAKGARGVIGTECETPALFAVEWAARFFQRFLDGQPVGKIALDLRREFFEKHNNILGLLYALYVDADTRVV